MNSSSKVCIDVKDLSLTFRSRKSFFRYSYYKALQNVSFQIFKGETLGIIGRNGCGKSTLLKVLAGILEADEGELIKNVDYVSLQSLSAGFEKQLSGEENAILSAMLLGHSKEEAIRALPQIKEFSELGENFQAPVKSYSSGMKARLGFSVAILLNADVLLIDETLGVGDAKFRKKAEAAIKKKMSSNQTVVFVSHSSSQIKRLCQRAVWLERGEVINVGPADVIIDEYERVLYEEKATMDI